MLAEQSGSSWSSAMRGRRERAMHLTRPMTCQVIDGRVEPRPTGANRRHPRWRGRQSALVNEPFDGYRRRTIPPPDAELTQVGPGTPGGEYLRRFWQPVAFVRDLERPLRVRILGEDLVMCRDGGGQIGVLHLHCAHRGTSPEFGIPLDRGIRCCYHGWAFDVDGRCLETPGEPRGSRLKERVWQGAYPAAKFTLPCNWLQAKDNSMDPVHTAFLHALSSGYQFTEAFGVVPELDWALTEAGMAYIATRRAGDLVWIRVCDFIPPNIHQFTREIEEATGPKPTSRPVIIRWAVPDEDKHTTKFELAQVDPAR